jgi:methionyl-tRNA formyltransferase
MSNERPRIAFFGGEPLGLPALETLVTAGLVPELVICNPDRPSGRGQKLTPPPIKTWALEHGIEVFQPTSFKDRKSLELITKQSWDLFVVVAYNFILPAWFLAIPTHGVINVHPSLLPKLRGASPIRTAILDNKKDEVGVTIMLMDEAMDHGPLLAQEAVVIDEIDWPIAGPSLDTILAKKGANLLAETIPKWLSQEITPTEQDHDEATYTKKFEKTDAELNLDPQNLPTGEDAQYALRKIRAFASMNDCFFFDQGKRVKIKSAAIAANGHLELISVTPEGKKEMLFSEYLKSR